MDVKLDVRESPARGQILRENRRARWPQHPLINGMAALKWRSRFCTGNSGKRAIVRYVAFALDTRRWTHRLDPE
jgi:hypothetical protein